MSEAVNTIQHGVLVHALFHWMALTLPIREDYEALYAQAIQMHSDGMQDIVKRYRKYTICRVQLRDSLEPDPLHIHSLALLDAYSLHGCFKAWLAFLDLLHGRRRRMSVHRLLAALRLWRSFYTKCSCQNALTMLQMKATSTRVMHRALQKLRQFTEERRWSVMLEARYLERGNLYFKRHRMLNGVHALRSWATKTERGKKRSVTFAAAKKKVTGDADAQRKDRILTRYHMQKWMRITRISTRLNTALGVLLRHRWKNILSTSFGAWLTIFVVRYRVNTSAKRLVSRRINCASWIAWFAWRRVFERSVLLRTDQRHTLELRNLETMRALNQSLGHSRRLVLRNQAGVARRRLQWTNMCRAVGPVYFRVFAQRTLTKWRLVHMESSIAICLQRIWRGHFIRKYVYKGRTEYILKYRLRIKQLRDFERFKRLRLVFSVFHLFHAYLRNVWCARVKQLNTRRTLMRLMQNVPSNARMRQKINFSAFHYKLKHSLTFVERLRMQQYQTSIIRGANNVRNADALQYSWALLLENRHYRLRLKKAKKVSNKKYFVHALLQIQRFRDYRQAYSRFVSDVHEEIERLKLQNAFCIFHVMMERRLSSKRIVTASVTKYTKFLHRTPKRILLKMRVYAFMRGIRRRVAYSFCLHRRVRSMLERLIRHIYVKKMQESLNSCAQKQFILFIQRSAMAQYLAVVHVRAFRQKWMRRAAQHNRRFALASCVSRLRRFAKKRHLLRLMNRGRGIDIQLAIISARKFYGLREEYTHIAPEIRQNSRRSPGVYKFWNTSYLCYSVSRKIVSNDNMKRKHLLRIAVSRVDVMKMRALRVWFDFAKNRSATKVADRIGNNIISTTYATKCRNCMIILRAQFLYRRRQTKLFAKILHGHFKRALLEHFRLLKYYVRVSINKRKKYIVSRLCQNRLKAFRHMLVLSKIPQRLKAIENVIRRRILLRTLYCVSKEKEIRIAFRDILNVGKRAHNRQLCLRFYRHLMPVIVAKRKLRRITRCFYLRHFMCSWLSSTAIEATIYRVRSKKNNEVKRACFSGWQRLILRSDSNRIAASEVQRRCENKCRISILCAWIEAIHTSRINAKFDIVRERNVIAKKRFALKHWQHHTIIREVEVWKKAKYIFQRILACVSIRKKQIKSIQRCMLYSKFRALSTAFRSMRYRFMIQRKEQAKTQDIATVLLLTKCKVALNFWCQSIKLKLRSKKMVLDILRADRRLSHYKSRLSKHCSYSREISAALDFLKQTRNVQAKMTTWKERVEITKSAKALALRNAQLAKILAYIRLYFAAWKTVALSDHLRRIAFAARLKLISTKDTLRFGFKGFIQNDKAGKVFK